MEGTGSVIALMGRSLLEIVLLPWHLLVFFVRRRRIRAELRVLLSRGERGE